MVASVLNDPQSLNSYAYARNNPIVFVDPDGQTAKSFTINLFQGVWEGLKETGRAIVATVQNPSLIITSPVDLAKQSYDDSAYLATSYANDPEGTQQQIEASFAWFADSWNNLSDEQKGRIAGYALEKGLEAYITAKAVNKGLSSGSSSTAQKISSGHAYDKHVVQGSEFSNFVNSRSSFANHIDNVMKNPTTVRNLERGRTGYWQESTNTIVIKDPSRYDMGTAFQPNPNTHGYTSNYDYFMNGIK